MKNKVGSLIALIVLSSFLSACQSSPTAESHVAVTPADRANVDWWMPRHEQVLERVGQGNVELIMLGDSITHRWERDGKSSWDRFYAPRNAVNMGFSGDRTQHVLWRLDHGEISGISPKLAVLMIGTNNSSDGDTPDEIADGIKAICARLRAQLPNTKILILTIFPRANGNREQRELSEHGATYNDQWAENDKASRLASEIADNEMIYYLDINQSFLDENGVLTREVMPDLLHLSEDGYKTWAEAIEPTVQKLMGEKRTTSDNEVTIAVGGDWDDKWGESGATQQSLVIGAAHDVILMVGDLSYDGVDGEFLNNIQNAKDWSAKVNAIVGGTPVLFVPGDHDSHQQDGDIMTYANALKYPDGANGVMPPTGKIAGFDYEGKYPYLWFNDIIDGNVGVRIVGTSSAFQETEYEPTSLHKYLDNTYAVGSENYEWIEAVYADARNKGYWIVHINHLPWIDMGKNQSFSDSQGLIDLASTYGVNILSTGSSHNVWRTKPLKIDGDGCPTIALTSSAEGANPACVGNPGSTHYAESDGLIQAHNGVAGKTNPFNLASYPDACDPEVDGEVVHYLEEGTCMTDAITGIVSLKITEKTLSGEFIKTDGSLFEPYTFIVERD